ncbi:MAG: hypothetical protein R6U70_11235 [Bacillota bacterium]
MGYLRVQRWILVLVFVFGALAVLIMWGLSDVISQPGHLAEQGRLLQKADPRTLVNATHALYPDVSAARKEVRLGGGMLTIEPTCPSDSWYVGEYTRAAGLPHRSSLVGALSGRDPGGPVHSVGRSDNRLWARTVQAVTVWWMRRTLTDVWDIGLSPALDWSLDLSLGGTAADLDLRGIPLEDFRLRMIRSEVDLYLGDNGEYVDMDVSLVGSNLTLYVSDDMPVVVVASGLLFPGEVSDSWRREKDNYYSPSYTGASSHAEIKIHSILGRFSVTSTAK